MRHLTPQRLHISHWYSRNVYEKKSLPYKASRLSLRLRKNNKCILKIYPFIHFSTSNLNKAAYTEKQHPCRKLLPCIVISGRVLSAGPVRSSGTYV